MCQRRSFCIEIMGCSISFLYWYVQLLLQLWEVLTYQLFQQTFCSLPHSFPLILGHPLSRVALSPGGRQI